MRQPPSSMSAAAISFLVVAAVSISTLLAPATAVAEVGEVRVGGRVGGGWAALTQPADPQGKPTLLQGSAFTGAGFTLGATGAYTFAEFPFGQGFTQAELLVGYQTGSGYAESVNGDFVQRREVDLDTTMLRLPVFAGIEHPVAAVDLRLMVGLELLVGLSSGATVTEENLPESPQPLFTTPTTHVGLAAALGGVYRFDDYAIPLDLRLTWDPFVPDTTVERFDGYRSPELPGEYQVGFDLYVGVTVGVDYEL